MDTSKPKQSARSLLLGGILPVVIYSVVEEYFGIKWGLIAGMALGVGEIVYEKISLGKVDTITWIGNGLLLAMGAISLFTGEGIWFKLQPAVIEAAMAVVLVLSVVVKRPFLVLMAEKQNTFQSFPEPVRPIAKEAFAAMTWRFGIFFLLHATLATWAALAWSTSAWAFLKGVGFTVSMVVYFIVEVLFLRKKIAAKKYSADFLSTAAEAEFPYGDKRDR